ncbi:hypothetical protein KEM56_000895 [Ascosphaera pollenicola]|nr:hypothetical protein KEM56_000895 [Ascosphaera pollenicola]
MATRRTTAKKETAKTQQTEKETVSDISPAVPADVIYKLLGFTLAMLCGPLAVYFLTKDIVFRGFAGNATFAGGAAAVAANVVLIAYLVVAWKDDKEEREHTTVGQIKKTE